MVSTSGRGLEELVRILSALNLCFSFQIVYWVAILPSNLQNRSKKDEFKLLVFSAVTICIELDVIGDI